MSHPDGRNSTQPAPGALPPVGQLDADLQRTVRRTAYMRQGFYVVVLLVALAGQVSGAVETLHIPLAAAIPAVGALELGGIVVLANADVRRRLGERAVASRILSVAIAAGAVAFNWLAHADHLLGGFFAGMSALGYLVWLMHTENQRRDRLRSTGDLAWTTPAYEAVGHWLVHPWLTRRARSLAKADANLGLYDSLAAARAAVRRERRQAAIAKVLHRKIRAAVDPTTADIAVHVYDLDEIATRLADGADYDGLTALIAADLAPARLAAGHPGRRRLVAATVDPASALPSTTTGSTRAALPAGEPDSPGSDRNVSDRNVSDRNVSDRNVSTAMSRTAMSRAATARTGWARTGGVQVTNPMGGCLPAQSTVRRSWLPAPDGTRTRSTTCRPPARSPTSPDRSPSTRSDRPVGVPRPGPRRPRCSATRCGRRRTSSRPAPAPRRSAARQPSWRPSSPPRSRPGRRTSCPAPPGRRRYALSCTPPSTSGYRPATPGTTPSWSTWSPTSWT